jgi:transcriptional regulator with XRE-family HTH domain
MVLLRHEIGDVLREQRRQQSRTLREVSARARVSLGYLSEVERGQKEASSELLASICGALEVPLSKVMSQVSERVADAERTEASAGRATVTNVRLAAQHSARRQAVSNGLVSAA